MPTTPVQIPTPSGPPIAGHLEVPADGAPTAWAIVAHCFDCADDVSAAVRIGLALTERRIGVLRFDLAGDADDLRVASAWLAAERTAPALLIGHSRGGAAAILAARDLPSVRAVATIAAPFEPSLQDALAELRRPLLIFHSPADAVIAVGNAARIYTAARHPKSFVSLDDADHAVTRRADAEYVAHVLAAWASRYVEMPPPPATVEGAREQGKVSASIGRDRYRTDILARGHGFVVDEPSALGGTDQGPTPYDLLGAALGACTAITLRMYADRKEWPLDEVDVFVAHDKVHAEDELPDDDGEPRRMDRLTREIRLTGALTDEQRSRLREIADRCPVHRTLETGLRVDTAPEPLRAETDQPL